MKHSLRDLFEHEIKDLYSAENQLIEALPKMQKAAHDSRLQKAFGKHLKQTEKQKERLEKVADMIGIKPGGEKCKGMEGLIKEGQKMIDMDAEPEVKDAGLIAAAQRVEHYEISGYGTAHHFAKMLDENDCAKLLSTTLEEERDTDESLNDLAIEKLNKKAMN